MNDTDKIQTLLRELPSVDRLLNTAVAVDLTLAYGHNLTVAGLRQSLEITRSNILNGQTSYVPMNATLVDEARLWLESFLTPTLRPVINGTGVIVHTNLGRAPLSNAARKAIDNAAQGYSTLEYNIDNGQRGSRAVHAEQLLTHLTNAEAALVVNNNAAAVLLMLTAICQGKEVIISRGQLVEIGGGFRIPDVMTQSGAKLVEVGTTNRTHLKDYAQAITEETAAIMVAHHSNYKIIGFTSEPSLAELAELCQAHDLPLLYDQGSGALLDSAPYGLEPEPTVLDGLAAGAEIVAFSGDKLLGGPQAGILCGRQSLISQLKRHPLARAVRADKLCLAGISATLTHYLRGNATIEVPIWRMIARPLAEIQSEAESWAAQLQGTGIRAEVVNGRSTVGGGSLPGTSLPSRLLSVQQGELDQLASRLRQEAFPVIGRIQDGRFLIDPRTILPEQVEMMLQSLINCTLT
ncbi:MAG: L-seryl-tRNA(Sec) selenium transferase [Chloroflexi bacterium]|nr:L-seryl-tRNA(Sec) selenium transferase [Chloroflexota bacterium]